MDRVSLLYIRSRPVPDFHWLKIAACSLGVNELAIQLLPWDPERLLAFVLGRFAFLSSIIERLFYNVKYYFCNFSCLFTKSDVSASKKHR